MTDPRIPPGLLGHQAGGDGQAVSQRAVVDPLGWCVIATTALLTWLLGPVVLAVFGALGFAKYWRAWRSGSSNTQCILGDVRIVLVYLAVLTAAGAAGTVLQFT